MALFPAWGTTVFRVVLATVFAGVVGVPTALLAWERTPYVSGTQDAPLQPVKFDHRHHVRDDGIDCVYCHSQVTRSRYAGVPATSVCMSCHAQVWTASPELDPVRRSWFSGEPLVWKRVHALPDHVFFDHSIHVAKGVGCVTCHGRVDQMAQVEQVAPLTMSWCLACHRAPEEHLRPPDKVTDMEWSPNEPQAALGARIARELHVHPTTDCTGCHR